MATIEDRPVEVDTPDRPDWLPEKFKTPEALASAYLSAVQKITEQGQELSMLRSAHTALEEFAALEAAALDQPEQDLEPEQSLPAPLETIAALAAQTQAHSPRPGALDRIKATLPQGPNLVQHTIEQAEEVVARQLPDWNEARPAVAALFQNDPKWQTRADEAAASGNVANLVEVLSDAAWTATTGRPVTERPAIGASRSMRLAAQLPQGGGGQPPRMAPEEEAWERIKAAGRAGSYVDLMSRQR